MDNMDNVVNTNNEEVTPNNDEATLTPEEVAAREELYNLALDKIKGYGLEWTFRSINFIVNREGLTFNQLRSCVFKNSKGEVGYDYIRATLLIIEAGLVGSKQVADNNREELEAKAYDIIEDWRNSFGYIGTLQILLITIMERKHFFMGTQDLRVLELLSYKNLQPDLVQTQLALDMETKISQSRALL